MRICISSNGVFTIDEKENEMTSFTINNENSNNDDGGDENANSNENININSQEKSNKLNTIANGNSYILGKDSNVRITINKEVNANSKNQRSCMYGSKFIGGSDNKINFGNCNQSQTVQGSIVSEIKENNATINTPNSETKVKINNEYNHVNTENCNNVSSSHFEGGENNVLTFGVNDQTSSLRSNDKIVDTWTEKVKKNEVNLSMPGNNDVNLTNEYSNNESITNTMSTTKTANSSNLCFTNISNAIASYIHGGQNNQITLSQMGLGSVKNASQTTFSDAEKATCEQQNSIVDDNEIQDIDVNPYGD